MAVIGITDGSEVTVSEPSRTVNVEELEQIATASYGSSTVKDYEQLANKPSIEGVTLVGDTELSEIGAAAADHTHSLESLGAASADHTHSLESLGAAAADHSHTLESLGAAAANHSHSLESLGAAAANHTHTPASIGAAEADHTHTPESIGAAAASHTHAASSITGLGSAALMDDDDFDAAGAAAAVLGTAQDAAGDATVYGALASAAAVEDALEHHTHTPAEIGAAPAVHTHTPASIGAAAESHEHDAADITSGVLDDELIPNLDASKITSGTFDGGRLPTVPITKGGTGATDAAAARTALGAAAANHTHTAADVGAADAVHTHGAGEITSGTLASDRLPTVPVSKGGTGATTAAAARTNLNIGGVQVNNVQLGGTGSGRQAVEGTMTGGNVCMMALKRGEMTMAIVIADVWSTNLAVWGTLPADLHFIRGSASGASGKITIQNNLTIGGSAIAIDAVGLKFGEVTTTDAAIAENFTRTQVDELPIVPIDKGGTGSTNASDARAALGITPANISALPSTGGAATGSLGVKSANINRDGANPSTAQAGNTLYLCDKDGERIGMLRVSQATDGTMQMALAVFSEDSGGEHGHWLNMNVGKSGACTMSVTNAAAWREALSVGKTQVNTVGLAGTGSGRQAVTAQMSGGNGCILAIKRGTMTEAIVVVDFWSNNLAIWGTLPSELCFVRSQSSGNTDTFTIQNNISITGSAVAIVGVGCTFDDIITTDAAMTENFTRTQMDGAEKCVEIAASASATVNFKGNTAMIYGIRGATAYAALVDYWGTEPVVIKSASAVPTITKTANSNSVTIKNNHAYPMQFTIVSLAPNV